MSEKLSKPVEEIPNEELPSERKYDVIWTLDKICGWNCSFCCVDAYFVQRKGDSIHIDANGLNLSFPQSKSGGSIYEQAANFLKEKKLALSLDKKLQVLENLKGISPKIDFSGGDMLLVSENLLVVKRAAELFGKDNVSITATGMGMKVGDISKYIPYIGELEFTYDNADSDYDYRQKGYNSSNLDFISSLAAAEIKTKAQIPLTGLNSDPENIRKIYENLQKAGVNSILLMRTFPVGRGATNYSEQMNAEDYIKLINEFRQLEKQLKGPKIKLQCALKYLFPDELETNPCSFLSSSVGITDQGELIASPWAYDQNGQVIDPGFIIGDLTKDKFTDLMAQPNVQEIAARLDENYGHCKMFAYLLNEPAFCSIFLNSDPLYTKK